MNHPFWRTRFLLEDPGDLERLLRSGVRECWIDVALGADVAPVGGPAEPPATTGVGTATATAAAPQGQQVPGRPVADVVAAGVEAPVHSPRSTRQAASFADELRQAAAVCHRGREAMSRMFSEARLGRAVDTEDCRALVEEVAASVERNAGALVSLARLKSQDDYTYMHSVAVCALMVALGRQLGMDEARCREAGLAGLVHDVGKALMPQEVLSKPGKLTEDEWRVMRSHAELGYRLLEEGGTAGEAALDVALHHHERLDGRGYPHRLAGDAISEFARMGAICDVYDAITSNRPYKAGWDPAESLARMASWAGHFDAGMFAAFVHSLGIYPTGSVVRLESGRLAVVAEQNAAALLAPVVVAFYSVRSKARLEPQRIDLSRTGCADRIVARASAEAAAQHGAVDQLWLGRELRRAVVA